MGLSAVAFALRNWKIIAVALAAAAALVYVAWLKLDNANLRADRVELETKLAQAVEVNARNAEFMKRQNDNLAAERAATEAVRSKAARLQADLKSAEQELENAPGINLPVDPFFDALGDSLRKLDAN